MEKQRPTSEELVKTIFAAALDKKATDVISLYMAPLVALTDYFVIATAGNDRQVESIVDEIERRVRTEHQVHPAVREGERGDSWIVLDYLDVVVHVFLQDARDEYRLEKLWSEAKQLGAAEPEPTDSFVIEARQLRAAEPEPADSFVIEAKQLRAAEPEPADSFVILREVAESSSEDESLDPATNAQDDTEAPLA